MHEALTLAHQAEEKGEVPVGALVVLNNKLVGQGFNQPISRCDPSAHAEIVALRDAAKALNNHLEVGVDNLSAFWNAGANDKADAVVKNINLISAEITGGASLGAPVSLSLRFTVQFLRFSQR